MFPTMNSPQPQHTSKNGGFRIPLGGIVLCFVLGYMTHAFLFKSHPQPEQNKSNSTTTPTTISTASIPSFPEHEQQPQKQTTRTYRTEAPQDRLFCEDTSMPCVFDIGHNTGQDTRQYLNDEKRKVKVVAVDANPVLMNESDTTFQSFTASGRLKLLTTGLVGSDAEAASSENKHITFWVNRNNKFSSFQEDLGCRDPMGKMQPARTYTYCRKVYVPTRTCSSLIHEFGKPEYIKIDIEGKDVECIHNILNLNATHPHLLPKYISIENIFEGIILKLREAGYTHFKAVDQFQLQKGLTAEQRGWSGPWGEEAVDYVEGKSWVSAQQLIQRLPLPINIVVDGRNVKIWYDLHAKRY